MRARCLFILNLQKRNFEGRLDFDHDHERLSVRVGIRLQSSVDVSSKSIRSRRLAYILKNRKRAAAKLKLDSRLQRTLAAASDPSLRSAYSSRCGTLPRRL